LSSFSIIPAPQLHLLDPTRRNPDSLEFESYLRAHVIGQDHVISDVLDVLQTFAACLHDPERPIATFLLLGPTGVGKTSLVERVDEALHHRPKANFIKINCGEYQESHTTNKLTGAAPGYIGYDDKRMITNEDIRSRMTPDVPITVVLFDEIEKAHQNFFRLLLNIFDRGTMTTSNQEVVDFRNCVIFMTSNLGVEDMENLLKKGIGYNDAPTDVSHEVKERRAKAAAAKHFAAEFMNRIDRILTFKTLSPTDLELILELELQTVQRAITLARNSTRLVLHTTIAAKKQLLLEGTSAKYNARELKRTVRKHLNIPLANFLGSNQVGFADLVKIDYVDNTFVYHRICANEVGLLPDPEWEAYKAAGLS
jgi:ATP-dependent Clp protease ATP-binding subunit ClpA